MVPVVLVCTVPCILQGALGLFDVFHLKSFLLRQAPGKDWGGIANIIHCAGFERLRWSDLSTKVSSLSREVHEDFTVVAEPPVS